MNIPSTIADYLRRCSQELGERILNVYPALQAPGDPVSDRFNSLLRSPFAAQRWATMGIVKRWEMAKAAAVIAECGTGKTLMALSALHVHSGGRPYTALVVVIATIKWPFGQYTVPQRHGEVFVGRVWAYFRTWAIVDRIR